MGKSCHSESYLPVICWSIWCTLVVCFCCTLPGLLTFYAWTWYFFPSLYSIFSLLLFSCLHPSSSLVIEFFFPLFSRLKDDLQPLYQLVLQNVLVSTAPIWPKACKTNSRGLVQNPSAIVAAWCLCFCTDVFTYLIHWQA